MNWDEYYQFLAESYEAEDKFWEEYFEDLEADEALMTQNDNFDF